MKLIEDLSVIYEINVRRSFWVSGAIQVRFSVSMIYMATLCGSYEESYVEVMCNRVKNTNTLNKIQNK